MLVVPVAAVVNVAVAPLQTAIATGCVLIVIVAPAVTVKFVALVAVLPPTATEIVPLVAPAGTVVVIEVTVLVVTIAVGPLN